jgi:hypothetical protein
MASSTWSRSRFGNRSRSLAVRGRNRTRFMPGRAEAVEMGCREMHRPETMPPRLALPRSPARCPVARPGSPVPRYPPTRAQPCAPPANRSRECGPPRCATRGGRYRPEHFLFRVYSRSAAAVSSPETGGHGNKAETGIDGGTAHAGARTFPGVEFQCVGVHLGCASQYSTSAPGRWVL